MGPAATDAELLQAWRAGHARAGEALFERYYSAVARFFLNKTDESSAQDLIQRTFLACVEGRERLRDDLSFRSYLFGTAYRLVCKHYTTRARDRARFDPAESSIQQLTVAPSSLLLEARQEQRILLAALRSIPLDHQFVLELFYWEKMTAAEIAGVLEIPLGTAKTRIRRGRALLAAAIREQTDSPALRESTLTNLSVWAADLRMRMRGRVDGPTKGG